MKTNHVTDEYSQSRHIHSPILLQAREILASQKRFVTFETYSWYSKTSQTNTTLDFKGLNTLISNKYKQLRGLYDIPVHFNEFKVFVYQHESLRHYAYSANLIYPKTHYRRYAWRVNSHGRYYRQGPKFTQHGVEKKVEATSDQYEMNVEQASKEWRENKQFRRDKAKTKHFCKCNCNDARYRRRWERDLISQGRYDEIYTSKSMFTSLWDCC